MKPTKKQLKEIAEVEKKVAKVCDTKKTTEVTRNDEGVIINKKTGKPHFEELYKNIKLEKSPDGVIFNKETGEPYKDRFIGKFNSKRKTKKIKKYCNSFRFWKVSTFFKITNRRTRF